LAALGLATGEDDDGRGGTSLQSTKFISTKKPPTSPPTEKTEEKLPEQTIKDKLAAELKAYCGDTSEDYKREVLKEITSFADAKNGKLIFIDKFNNPKFSDKWAASALGKLREKVKAEEEARHIADDVDSEIV
jgi:hypothetical protein